MPEACALEITGVRHVEIDCWDGVRNEPIVTHGNAVADKRPNSRLDLSPDSLPRMFLIRCPTLCRPYVLHCRAI
eukprot:5377632-Prymnesium_polylepis.1